MNQELQPQASEGLKSLHLMLENFKNIGKTEIEIGGRSLIFMGKNGSGKSTLIQAMMSPMDAKLLPSEPIKQGEERARISHKIGGNIQGEYKEYIMDLYFTKASGKGRLVVTNEKGEVMKTPATLLKSIIGDVSFDVMKWLNDDKAKKLKTIKALTGCQKEIDVINLHIDNEKAKFKTKKDRADDLEATLKNSEFSQNPDDVEKYSEPIDISPLQQELYGISKKQVDWDGIKNQVQGFHQEVQYANDKIMAAGNEINRLQNEIKRQQQIIEEQTAIADKANGNIKTGTDWLNSVPRPSVEEVNNRINLAIAHNEKHSRIKMLSDQTKEKFNLRNEAEQIKGEIKKLEDQRSALINNSQLPIEGLTFTDDEIFINGLPLEEGQVNTAKLFDIGVEVAMALNPNLKIIFLHDGSLFDHDSLKSIVKKIEDRGYMAVIEMVDYQGGDLEVKFTEKELA